MWISPMTWRFGYIVGAEKNTAAHLCFQHLVLRLAWGSPSQGISPKFMAYKGKSIYKYHDFGGTPISGNLNMTIVVNWMILV